MDFLNLYLALAPALALALYIYWKDKHEKEPIGVLVVCFVLGSLCCLPAGFFNAIGAEILGFDFDGENGLAVSFFMAFFVVGLGEELCKYLVLVLYALRKPSFNEPFDGIVYAVMISLGFAALENVFYVSDGGVGVAFARMFTAVPMHAAFAVLMGYQVGLAKFMNQSVRTNVSLKGLFLAVFFHGAYDFVLFQDSSVLLTLLVFPIMIWAFILSRKAMRLHSKNSPFNK